MERKKNILLALGIVAFMGVIGLKVTSELRAQEQEIKGPTMQMVAALAANDPSLAPPEGAEYVKDVRKHFGRIVEARFLDIHVEQSGSGHTRQSDVYSEVFVRGKRGAGVIELDFDGDRIWGADEVDPEFIHSDLSAADEAAVERGFKRRGGKPGLF